MVRVSLVTLLAIGSTWAGGASAQSLSAPSGIRPGTVLYVLEDGPGRTSRVSAAYRMGDAGLADPLEVTAQTSFLQALRVSRDEQEGLALAPANFRSGWLIVDAPTETETWISGAKVGTGSLHLSLGQGMYSLTLRAVSGAESEHTARVLARAEARVVAPAEEAPEPVAVETLPEPPPARQPPSPPVQREAPASATRSAEPMTPPEIRPEPVGASPLISGTGGETVLDTPFAEWRMTSPPPRPEQATPPAPPRTNPTSPRVRPEARERRSDLRQPDPPAEEPEPPSAECPAPSVLQFVETAEALIASSDYATARVCLLQHLRLEPQDAQAQDTASELEIAILNETTLGEQMRGFVSSIREELSRVDPREDTGLYIAFAERLLDRLPGDPATARVLRTSLTTTVQPQEGSGVTFVYVPGAHATLATSPLRALMEEPPPQGYGLSQAEITNAQFVTFLNSLTDDFRSDYEYVTDTRRALYIHRNNFWGVRDGMADLPVVDATWHGAQAYAEWVGGRLPETHEWEWAHRVGSAASPDAPAAANRSRELQEVLEGDPDGLGLYNMAGNAGEWVLGDPAAAVQMMAGGSIRVSQASLRSTLFRRSQASTTGGHIGFRVLLPSSSF